MVSPLAYTALLSHLLWWTLTSFALLSLIGYAYFASHREGGLVHAARLREARLAVARQQLQAQGVNVVEGSGASAAGGATGAAPSAAGMAKRAKTKRA